MSFTFNGIASTTYLTVNKVKQSILPPLAPRNLSVPGRAGAYDFGVETGTREIAVDVTIKGTSLADLRTKVRNIAYWLFNSNLCTLVLADEPDKTYYARVSGNTDLDDLMEFGRGTIVFLCPVPYADGLPRSQSVTSGGSVTYFGTAKTYPVFTVDFTGGQSSFRIDCGSSLVLVTNNFVNGNQLIIDNEKALVTINGTRVMDQIDLTSAFFPFVPGSNSITFTPTSLLTVTVNFTEKWL